MLHSKRLLTMAGLAAAAIMAPLGLIHAQGSGTVLKAADAQTLIPANVFYRGQTATTQSAKLRRREILRRVLRSGCAGGH